MILFVSLAILQGTSGVTLFVSLYCFKETNGVNPARLINDLKEQAG